ncbi:MAG: hypothetical protein IT168_03985 [Bryobacterales bacterium]|nr:hypothetical protein [Bryobacterales bacterium]
MTRVIACLLIALFAGFAQQRPWQRITVPTYAEAARRFADPPPEYAMVLWWFWNGPMTEADIVRDLKEIQGAGVRSVLIWPYYGVSIDYLSPTWFERVRFAVGEARRLNIRVWLMDEGGYPSGFIGGKVTNEYPELAMRIFAPPDGEIQFRTSATRHVNRPGFAKDAKYSLYDPLNPAATQRFLTDVHEQYKKYIGPEFGRTVMGFMGDEPSVAGLPYTPAIYDEFRKRKGYELKPHITSLAQGGTGEAAKRVRADFWDVWTDLYSENFFEPQARWCAQNKMEYIVHLCGEEDMPTFLKLNGDYFKCNRAVQIPGVDAIWRQIWPGVIADYPKLASSAAHLHGRPRSFTESYAVYGMGLSLEMAKWVMDHQFVRGINHFQAMEFLSAQHEFREYFHPPDWHGSPLWSYFSQLATYSNRISYILSVGRPAAEIALYYPTTSGWMGDFEANKSALAIARELLETQRDFDFIDEDGLRVLTTVRDGALWNQSGQAYRTVIVPPVTAISRVALAKLEALQRAGGKVVFVDSLPKMAIDKTYRDAPPTGDAPPTDGLAWATPVRSVADVTTSDVKVEPRSRHLKVLHRKLADSDVYFFFNEGAERIDADLRLAGKGKAEVWDATTGEHRAFARLVLEGFETKLVVRSPRADPKMDGGATRWETVAEVTGDWRVQLGAGIHQTGLKTWAEMGAPAYWGAGVYSKQVTIEDAGGPLSLDLGEVRYAARLKVNGRDLGVRAWRPYRWDLQGAVRPGVNAIEVEVRNTRANELADQARYDELEKAGHFRNSYIRTYRKFDLEMLPSGLIGPVRILRPVN